MKLEVRGKRYTAFTSATADVRIDTLSNSFSFAASPNKERSFPFGRGDEVVVSVDGEDIITGYIMVISGSGSSTSHVIDITGWDKTKDLVDSSLAPIKDIRPPITFKRVVELVIASIGSDLDVVDHTNVSFDKAEDIIAIERGDNAFNFLEKLARKKNVILSSDEVGNVVIQNSIGRQTNAIILNQIDNMNNNVIQYSFTYDDTGRFSRYEVIGQMNVNVISNFGSSIPKKVVNQRGFIEDRNIREGRQLVLASDGPGSNGLMEKRAAWELNVRRARSRVYKVTVSGFRNQDGEIWTPNMLVRVLDDNAQINDTMLINSVTYRMDINGGRTSEIGLVNRDAYTLSQQEIDITNAAAKTTEKAFNFTGIK